MKTGKSLIELATEIERQRETRVDYIDPTQKIGLEAVAGDVVMVGLPSADLALNDLAHRQVGDNVGVPAKYYDRMRADAPELLATNVNHWFQSNPENRMVRTLDGRARAFLSDRYRPLENADLAEAVLPALSGLVNLEIVSCEITERRLYIKAVDKSCIREVRGQRVVDGRSVEYDHVSPSLTISNSEVGSGALMVEAGAFTHACKNMALFREKSLRKYHVGGKHELADGMVAMLSAKTRQLTDAATWAQVGDVVRNALNPDAFDDQVAIIQGLTSQKIEGGVIKVVDLASRHFDIQEGEKKSVLKHLIEGGDLSRYGLFNAITRTAEDLESYDRATDFERIGGKVIELAANDWKRIAEAA